MEGDKRRLDVIVRDEMTRMPSIFSGDDVSRSQNIERAQRHVLEITDWGGHYVKACFQITLQDVQSKITES